MRRLLLILPVLALSAPTSASAAPNVPLCLAIQKNFNDCHARASARRRRWEHHHDWDDGDWDPHPPPPSPEEACAAWIYELQANHCM